MKTGHGFASDRREGSRNLLVIKSRALTEATGIHKNELVSALTDFRYQNRPVSPIQFGASATSTTSPRVRALKLSALW